MRLSYDGHALDPVVPLLEETLRLNRIHPEDLIECPGVTFRASRGSAFGVDNILHCHDIKWGLYY